MGWIKQLVILAVFVVLTSARIHPKLVTSERFEFCVARNLSRSSLFNEEDKERMEKIVLETSERMHEMSADPGNAVNTKTMLRLFAAALACVVSDCDSSVRSQRERACITALEACAESLKEPTGAEVVDEIKRIFAAMRREISILDEMAVTATPVEDKKKERLEKEMAAEKKERLEKEIEAEKKERLEKEIETEKRLEKEIEAEKKELLEKEIETKKKEEEIQEMINERMEEASEVKERHKRAYINTFQYQSSGIPLQSNPTVQSIIEDKLLKSATFRNFFSFGLSQEDAIFYSRSMVLSGLNGYRFDIIQEAMNAVAASLSRLGSFAGPNDYAYTISRAIASVLSAHELTFYADGLNIGSSLVYQLDSMLGSNPSSTFALSPSFGSASVSSFGGFDSAPASSFGGFDSAPVSSSAWGSSSAFDSSQSSGMASVQVNPSYVESSFAIPPNPQNDKIQFQNRLSYSLSQSPTITETFCIGPFPGVYKVMESAFSDYGDSIASSIANVITNSLSMLPTEAACTQFAEVISEVAADILSNNGFLPTADPQVIVNKISDLLSPSVQSNPPQNPPNFGQETISGSDYPLNPSFSDYSDTAPEISAFSADQTPDSTISRSEPDMPFQQQNPVQTNSTEFSSDGSPLPIQPSTQQDLPAELSFDGMVLPGGLELSSDGMRATNDSWVIVDQPTDIISGSEQTNQTADSTGIATPIILEPGPVIPANIPSDTRSDSESTISKQTTAEPEIMQVTKMVEVTTSVPLTTNIQFSTAMAKSEVTTPAPKKVLKDAIENPSELSKYLLEEMSSTLKAMNVTFGNKQKQLNLPGTSRNSTLQTTEASTTLEDSKPTEKSLDSHASSSSFKTDAEVQPSVPTQTQKNVPSDEVPLVAPKPITDELSALVFADKVSSIVSNAISLIRSADFQLGELCRRLNELAPMVDLPPLGVCEEIPLIDYLLHVLNAVTYSLGGE